MLLIAHEYVRHKRAFARQKRDSQLDSLTMPVLAVLALVPDPFNCLIQLMQEPELSTHAEVRNRKETKLLQHILSGQLNLNSGLTHEVLQRQWRNLHDVPDV
jgi:hypothetical protein